MHGASPAGGVELGSFVGRGLVSDSLDEQFDVADGVVIPRLVFEFGGVQFGCSDGAVEGPGVAGLLTRPFGAGVPVTQERVDCRGLAARGDPGQVLADQNLEEFGVARLVGNQCGAGLSTALLGGR